MADTARISFRELGLQPTMVAAIEKLGFEHPTEVQALAIPRVLEGNDIVVQSRTGTGKTLAYGIPMVEKVDPTWARTQGLVLVPTRELALQVKIALSRVAEHRGVRVVAIYGGDSMKRQMDDVRSPPQIIAATPGRLLDHMNRRTVSLKDCFWAVLDEADEMLSMGFYEEVERIMRQLPKDRQTLLFSATVPQAVLSVAHNYLDEPERISLSDDYLSVREIEHLYVLTTEMEKERTLARILDFEDPDSCIVFCNTRDEARRVSSYLKARNYQADLISGELTQKERERVMARIKAGKLKIMVATDVAARGIDVVGLSHVVCFSTSESPEVYIHRTGRTGRVGRSGQAISLVSGRDLHSFNRTEKANGLKIKERPEPTEAAVRELRANRMWDKLKAYALEHELDEQDEVALLMPRILESPEEGKPILFALLKHFFEERKFREKAAPIAVDAGEAEEPYEAPSEARAPMDPDGGRKRRRRRRDEGPSEAPREAREPRERREPREPREGRRPASTGDPSRSGYLLLAVGKSHGATAEEIERLVHRFHKHVRVETSVLEEETLLTVPEPDVVSLLAGLASARLRGKRVYPMQILGDVRPVLAAASGGTSPDAGAQPPEETRNGSGA